MKNTVSAKELFDRIDTILGDHSYLQAAFATMEKLQAGHENDTAVEQKIAAIENMVKEREHTNQKIIALLQEMAASAPSAPLAEEETEVGIRS